MVGLNPSFLWKARNSVSSLAVVMPRTSALRSLPLTTGFVVRLEREALKERERQGKLHLSPLKINVPSVKRVGGISCKFLPSEFMWEHPINNPLVISSPWDLAKVRRWLLKEVSRIKLPRLAQQCAWRQIVPAAPYFGAFIILSELNYINSNHLYLTSKHSNSEACFKSWCWLITS